MAIQTDLLKTISILDVFMSTIENCDVIDLLKQYLNSVDGNCMYSEEFTSFIQVFMTFKKSNVRRPLFRNHNHILQYLSVCSGTNFDLSYYIYSAYELV